MSAPDDDLVEIDIDPNFDFTDLSKRTTKPVVNTVNEGGSTSGIAQDPLTFGSSGIGGTGSSANCGGCNSGDIGCEIGKLSCEFTSSLGGLLNCKVVGIPCWIIIVAVIILILVAIIKGRR